MTSALTSHLLGLLGWQFLTGPELGPPLSLGLPTLELQGRIIWPYFVPRPPSSSPRWTCSYGLRYDDLYDPYYDLDIKEALSHLPREIVDARNQRLKRATDLSMKHEYLPDHLQAQQTPFRSYLQEMLTLVKKEKAEREALGALPLYQRTIP